MKSIRGRLLAILAVPTLGLVLLSVTGVVVQANTYAAARQTESSVRLVLATQALIHELQRERGLTNGLLAGEVTYRTQVDDQRGRTDTARAELDRASAATGPQLAAAMKSALGRLGPLGDLRAEVDAGAVDRPQSLAFYTTAISELAGAGAEGQQGVSDAPLLANLDALRALGDAKEATALERGFLNGVFSAGRFEGREYASFTEIRGTKLAGLKAFTARATDAQQSARDTVLRSPAATTAREMEQRAIDGAVAPALDVVPAQWWAAMTTLVDDLDGVQRRVGADATSRTTALRADAVTALTAYVALALFAIAAAVGLTLLASRSITRPLQALAADAREAAMVRLPATVARIQADDKFDGDEASFRSDTAADLARRQDEIADVAQALNQVQLTAVELAVEQAVLRRNAAESMASLARRNQNLLRRQLGFITQLERDESDSEALANLFELDHLATRMRRNAESLLVLIGERSPRQWSEPVAVSNVVRAALSEVEEYRRVSLRRLDDALVLGSTGAELAHLLAELVENAVSFSPPNREVEIYGQAGSGGSYVLAVVDHGIGMIGEELERSNARLAGTEAFLVAPTRYLGHYVVGQLARRLGIEVRLNESPITGITARIVLPAALLVAPESLGVAPDPPGDSVPPAQRTGAAALVGPTARPFRLDRAERRPIAVAVLEPPDVPPSPDKAPRTRNGLQKRVRSDAPPAATVPRSARPVGQPTDDHQPPARPAGGLPPADWSPERTRGTITGFRAGMQRRAQERVRDERNDERPDGAP